MSETKWTPGPWALEEVMPEDKDWGLCEITASDDSFVATAVIGVANARLIAAGPDMAEALQLFLDNCDNSECMYCEKARAALAKARGQA